MAEDKDERKIYEEKLQVILHTCLLYNSSQALGNHVNYVLHGKGNKGFKDKNKPLSQLKNIYNSLCAETSRNTNKEVDLDDFLITIKPFLSVGHLQISCICAALFHVICTSQMSNIFKEIRFFCLLYSIIPLTKMKQ